MVADSISVVLPAFNEELHIGESLAKIEQYLMGSETAWEIIVVEDGSLDNTYEVAGRYATQSPHRSQIRIIRNDKNRGKGYSVRRGFQSSQHDIVLFTDSDLSAPVEEIAKLLSALREKKVDGAFGSRAVLGSIINVHQPKFREIGGKFFNLLMRLITGLPFKDTQCGLKAFRRIPFIPIFERQRIERFGFDVELLYLARKEGLGLAEIPVVWSHCEESKVRFLRDAANMFMDLWRIRFNDWKGRYNR